MFLSSACSSPLKNQADLVDPYRLWCTSIEGSFPEQVCLTLCLHRDMFFLLTAHMHLCKLDSFLDKTLKILKYAASTSPRLECPAGLHSTKASCHCPSDRWYKDSIETNGLKKSYTSRVH